MIYKAHLKILYKETYLNKDVAFLFKFWRFVANNIVEVESIGKISHKESAALICALIKQKWASFIERGGAKRKTIDGEKVK